MFDLAIFDCDGVLVDSEHLAVRTEALVLGELGWPISEDEIVERFVGRPAAYMHAEVERVLGQPVDWDRQFGDRYRSVFATELRAVDGVLEVLDALDEHGLRTAVATSSTRSAITYKFELTGIGDRFGDAVFCTEDVANPKPAPDVFLLAAASMGVAPARCAVIEDSAAGVQAGRAAGMSVFAFAGGVTTRDRLVAPGVRVFDAMAALTSLLVPAASAGR